MADGSSDCAGSPCLQTTLAMKHENTTTLLWLMSALVVAAALRFTVLEIHPLWCDELATLQRLKLPVWRHLVAMKGSHPLYELLLHAWMPADGSDAWMRIPSAALGVLAVWLTWLMMRSLGRREALVAAWLVALLPLHLMYSRIARPYSLACTLALLSNLSLLWALKRRRLVPTATYVLTTALMIHANLVAGSIWIAQGLFVLWFYRKRLRRLPWWIVAHACIGLLMLPWMIFSFRGAVIFGVETQYTAQQSGRLAKACYLAFTLGVGETVHPLNFSVLIPAFIGFGAAGIWGLARAVRRRSNIAVLLLVQLLLAYVVALWFAAAAPKHLTIILPALAAILAVGLAGIRLTWRRWVLTALVVVSMGASILNYFGGREFADADMVTPWREMVAKVKASEDPNDVLIIGYRPDSGAYDMFLRYYRRAGGTLEAKCLFADKQKGKDESGVWKDALGHELWSERRVWLLLHDGDPWDKVEHWLRENGYHFELTLFQEEEHTLQGLQEGLSAVGKYHSHLYRLYLIYLPPVDETVIDPRPAR